ncbi:MAG: hypothetical protein KC933_04520 [Myxococcales bacterium]|nr:hypothetical protein [Myxococcales bacterium]
MTDFDKLGPRLFEALRQRALNEAGDPHKAVDAFMEAAQAGARVLYSDGDGEVALLVPLTDGYDGPNEIAVAPDGDPTRVLAQLDDGGVVKVEGVGRFRVFEMSPLQLKKRLAAQEGRPRIAFRGEGGDGWSPLGFDGWFWEDFPLVLHLATEGGLEVRPDVEVDPRDPSWKALEPELREFVESSLGRPVSEVVHTSTLREALDAAAARADGAGAGARRGSWLGRGGAAARG